MKAILDPSGENDGCVSWPCRVVNGVMIGAAAPFEVEAPLRSTSAASKAPATSSLRTSIMTSNPLTRMVYGGACLGALADVSLL